MDAELIDRIETNMERAAAALFAAAVGYAIYLWLRGGVLQPALGAYGGGASALAFLLCSRVFTAARRKPHFPVPVFDLREVETFESGDELLLTDADRLRPVPGQEEPLVLDDILAEIGPDARVVRLFDRRAMPTPGQLQSRIDSHLEQGSAAAAPDASQALSDALAELRRSLR